MKCLGVYTWLRIIALFLSIWCLSVNCCGDYYWREYEGVVPADAIPVGKGADGDNLYIGRAYLHGYGVFQGTIKPGVENITLCCWGAKHADRMIEIELAFLMTVVTYVSAFWWGSSDQSTPPTYFYNSKRLLQGPVYVSEAERRRIPAVPMQMPLQTQLSPLSNVHNVQLVPCLCPVSTDGAYETQQSQEAYYVGPNGNLVPQQQQQQQQHFYTQQNPQK